MSSDPQHGDTMATDHLQRATARAAGCDSQHDNSMSTDHPQCDAAKAAAAPQCGKAIATRRPKRATAIAASKAFPGAIKAVEKIVREGKKGKAKASRKRSACGIKQKVWVNKGVGQRIKDGRYVGQPKREHGNSRNGKNDIIPQELANRHSYFDGDQLGSNAVSLFNYLRDNDGGRGASRKRVKLGIDMAET